ncbi:nitrite/sulfite reductase [Fusobacterium necrogenes]|uniref:nitrite/sulfite reductase n=1 Tax=Fusobacterium necrogenes TaxID=858 RepID=UPI00255C7CDD|nr:nitrite/sulfite reductase [Fusobacterium necrogenes]
MKNQYEILKNEIKAFHKEGYRFLNKEISVGDFKKISGGMGVYAQRGGEKFMIRLRTNSGLLPLNQLKLIDSFLENFNIEKLHLTTRQAIQLHDLSIDDVCDIMEKALDNGLYTRGGGGNFPRNVSLSPMSGVEKNEAFDVTEFANAISKYLMERITTYHLPRKLKISMSSSSTDGGNSTINDLGFIAKVENGEAYFDMYIAGGLGNNPEISIPYGKKVKPEEILYYVEAMVNLFMAEGDYNNKAKARTRYIPKRMGREEFLVAFDKHLEKVKNSKDLTLNLKAIISETQETYTHSLAETPSLLHQRQDGLYTLIIHPVNGQLYHQDFKNLVEFLENNKNAEARLSMNEDIYVRDLTEEQVKELSEIVKNYNGETKIRQSVSCIGVPTCQLGVEQSQTLLKNILSYLSENNIKEDKLPSINISGCHNSCGRHQASDLGFVGGKKKVGDALEDVFDLYVDGIVKEGKTTLGEKIGTIIMRDIPKFILKLGIELEEKKLEYKEFIKDKQRFQKIVEEFLC